MDCRPQRLPFRPAVLVIDDDERLRDLLELHLTGLGFAVRTVASGKEGLHWARIWAPDLVILDVRMPEIGGWEVCRRLREFSTVPVLILTAYDTPHARIKSLQSLADDHLSKPFDLREFDLRVQNLLTSRLNSEEQAPRVIYEDDVLFINTHTGQVWRHWKPVELAPRERAILLCLVRHLGQDVPTHLLEEEAWGTPYVGADDMLRVCINRIRQRIEANPREPRYIKTVHGVGYRFEPQPTRLR